MKFILIEELTEKVQVIHPLGVMNIHSAFNEHLPGYIYIDLTLM